MAKDRKMEEIQLLKLTREQLLARITFRKERGENCYDLMKELEEVDLLIARTREKSEKPQRKSPDKKPSLRRTKAQRSRTNPVHKIPGKLGG